METCAHFTQNCKYWGRFKFLSQVLYIQPFIILPFYSLAAQSDESHHGSFFVTQTKCSVSLFQ